MAAAVAVLEDGSEVQVVDVRGLLDAGLQPDTGTGGGADQGEVLNQNVAVLLHVIGQGRNKEVSNSHIL